MDSSITVTEITSVTCAKKGSLSVAGMPIEFLISVKAAKQDPFSASAQNELIVQLLQGGAIDPKRAVELMSFEGRDQVLKNMKNNE